MEGGYHRHHFLRFDNTDTMLMGRFVWHGENRQVQIQTTIDSMHLVLIRAAGADVDALPVSIDTANRGPAR